MSNTKQDQSAKNIGMRTLNAQDCGITTGVPSNSLHSFATYARLLMQNWRQGTVWAQGRSDVSLTNKKPWKQKGTGRARAGSARSPLWRGGGVIFGPQERVRQLKLNKKMRRLALLQVLEKFATENKIMAFDWNNTQNKPKTSLAKDFLKQASLLDKKVVLFIKPDDVMTYASFANIKNVSMLYFDQPNVFDLVNSDQWIFLQKDMDAFKEMVAQWV